MFSLAWQIEQHLERPRRSRRRNSDSELYYTGKKEDAREGEKREERFLADEKYAFVQRYLENVSETHSFTIETSDSGIKTHGAPSELGMEDISGNYLLLSGLAGMTLNKFFLRRKSIKVFCFKFWAKFTVKATKQQIQT